MKDWFYGLDSREQLSVMAAGVFVLFALFYFGLWQPLDRGQKSLTSSVATWERSLAELGPLISRVNAGASNLPPAGGPQQSLVVIVDTTLRQRNLYNALQRSQPTGPNGIRVEFRDIAFDDAMRWLGDLNSRYAMQVQSGSFSQSSKDVPGRVNVSLTLER